MSRAAAVRIAVGGTVVVAFAVVAYVLLKPSGAHARDSTPIVSVAGMADRSGVRVVRVALSGDGGLVDLRFQVVDSDRAVAVHDPNTPPLMIDERTGGVVGELLMGHIHSGPPKLGLTYYLIFLNPGVLLRPGGRVTVQLGHARLAHVPVL